MISLLLAIVLAFSSCAFSLTAFAQSYPYTETDDYGRVTYHRLSGGVDMAFFTDYDEMVQVFRNALLNHRTEVDYYFATTDETYAYSYRQSGDLEGAQAVAASLYSQLLNDVFEIGTGNYSPGGGEYLYNSIINIETSANGVIYIGDTFIMPFTSAPDDPIDDGSSPTAPERYYTFRFRLQNIEYYTTLEQEIFTQQFAAWFSRTYLRSGISDYQIVKTIYDFIVRNTTYDWEVFRRNEGGNTAVITDERYNIAHAAYGAICGNMEEQPDTSPTVGVDFDSLFPYKLSVTSEKVSQGYNKGLAVCEGYSKLFYYLCTYNGIPCHIVDGDYTADSEKASDPHEWNYVYLEDERHNGKKWFQVDCTKASQNSFKEVDYNDYNYFLCGLESVYFGFKNHQQPYENKGAGFKQQLYDWYAEENLASEKDYLFAKVLLNNDDLSQGNIICRSTYYQDENKTRSVYIYSDRTGEQLIEIDEDGVVLRETEGFIYTGKQSSFSCIIPYLVNRVNILDDGNVSEGEFTTSLKVTDSSGNTHSTVKDAGRYSIKILGADSTSLTISFSIVPRDMSREAVGSDLVVVAPPSANYTGQPISPSITVTDPYRNTLTQGKDYTVSFSFNNQSVGVIQEIGTYKVNINYAGNYRGTFTIDFVMDRIDLGHISYASNSFQYLPEYYRKKEGLTTPAAYFKRGIQNGVTIGSYRLYADTDFTVSASGGMSYGSTGTIQLTGIDGPRVLGGTVLNTTYKIDQKFDISGFDGSAAENDMDKYYYSGSPVKPTEFSVLDKYLEQGVDYKITGYKNNDQAGIAYVMIEGINGCKGKATMQFYINHPKNLVKPTAGSKIKLSKVQYVYDGKAKKPTVKFLNASGKTIDPYYYTVSYKNNTNVGTATVVVKLRGGFTGTFNVGFTIVPKATSISKLSAGKKSLTVKWRKQATQTTGYQIRYSTSNNFKNATVVTVSKNTTLSKTIKKLKSKKKYYVTVRTYKTVGGKKYYSSWAKGTGTKVK